MAAFASLESTALPLSNARSDFSVATVGLLLLMTTGGFLVGVADGFGELELGFLVGLSFPLFWPADCPPLLGLASAWAASSSRPSHQPPAAVAATRAITTGTATSAQRRGFSSASAGTYGAGVQPGSTAMGTGSGSSSGSTSGSGSAVRASGTGAAWAYSVSCWGPL